MFSLEIELSLEERRDCREWGQRRFRESRQRGLEHRAPYRAGDSHTVNEYLSCCGELAVAKVRGEPWDKTINTFKGVRDQGPFEVRTRSRNYYELFLREHEPRGVPWVLVTAEREAEGKFDVRGWVFGFEVDELGRAEDFGGRGRPLQVIATHNLHPAREIVDWPRDVLTHEDYQRWRFPRVRTGWTVPRQGGLWDE